jgi:murein lipoprotein
MKFKLATLTGIGLLTFALSACSQMPAKTAEAPKEAAKPTISDEAQKALAQAEADVKAAQAKFALWTTAETALKQAQEAAKAGDSGAVIKQAAYVSEQVKGGFAQQSYPSTEQK